MRKNRRKGELDQMADKEKELRQMNRTELIEIIYALQQNEKTLREEKENLQRQVEDRTLRIDKAGSIAEAALSLNHIFEDAQKACEQYLESIREREAALRLGQEDVTARAQAQVDKVVVNAQQQAENVVASAQQQAEKILADAQGQAAEILAQANTQAQASMKECEEAEQRIRRMAAAFKKQCRNFLDQANAFMEENPDFAQQMKGNQTDSEQQEGENQ